MDVVSTVNEMREIRLPMFSNIVSMGMDRHDKREIQELFILLAS